LIKPPTLTQMCECSSSSELWSSPQIPRHRMSALQ
jgi:hypothetical protein